MKKYSSLKSILAMGLALNIVACASLEKAILHSDVGKQAVSQTVYKYINNFNSRYAILDLQQLSQKDPNPDEDIFLFIHGWGGSTKELFEEEKNEPESKLSIMKDVYHGRVLLADYPPNGGIKKIFSGIEEQFDNFISAYQKNNGKSPKFKIMGHSLGTQFTRLFDLKYSGYISNAGLIAGVNNGIYFGILDGFIGDRLPENFDRILSKKNQPHTKEDYEIAVDLLSGSPFFKELNKKTETPLPIEYNFYTFVSKNDSFFIPGEDDGTVALSSARPKQLIDEGHFEWVRIGDDIIFEGDVNHLSINNPWIFRTILESFNSNKSTYSYTLPDESKATHYFIPECSPLEKKIREKQKQLMNNPEFLELLN